MDWTGGTRRRFAPKKGNAILQRQKAYFARARAALNAPSQRSSQHNASQRPSAKRHFVDSRSVPSSQAQFSRGQEHDGSVRDANPRGRTSYDASGAQDRAQASRVSSSSIASLEASAHPPSMSAEGRQVTSKHPGCHPDSYHRTIASANDMNEEERLLLANRRRLLARSDWLGLAPAQPLTMKFSSTHDRDRIGKRRRVDKPALRKDETADNRVFTPRLERRLQHPDYVMSGALPGENFDIKIGTDALRTGTQTQASRRSHTPANTSLRPPSTELDLLSEESMLLDANEDGFDPLPHSDGFVVPEEPVQHQTQHVCDVANMVRPPPTNGPQSPPAGHENQDIAWDIDEELDDREEIDYKHRDQFDQDTVAIIRSEQRLSQGQNNLTTLEGKNGTSTRTRNEGETEGPTAKANMDEDEDDELWRNFLNVAQPVLSNPSTTAVKSSSLHITSSESDHRPMLLQSGQLHLDTVPPSGKLQDTENQFLDIDVSHDSGYLQKLPSPSTSLKCITDLANQPLPANPSVQEEEREDALWREFVCGAEEDSDTSSQIVAVDRQSNTAAANPSTLGPASSSLMVSDLGTSNKTTVGGDTVAAEESMCGIDKDSIEEEDDDTTQIPRPKNIHATKVLNPKRFLRARGPQPALPQRSSKFAHSSRIRTKESTAEHSVYDLLDSDGNNLG